MNKSIPFVASLGFLFSAGCYEEHHHHEPEVRVVEQPVVVVPYQPTEYYVYGGSYYYWHPQEHYYVRMTEPPRGPNVRYVKVEKLPPREHEVRR